jgi:hypothetical protein
MELKTQNLKELYGKDFYLKDFPQECPYTFEQVMKCRPWIKES